MSSKGIIFFIVLMLYYLPIVDQAVYHLEKWPYFYVLQDKWIMDRVEISDLKLSQRFCNVDILADDVICYD